MSPITNLTLMEGPARLFNEWLRGYFDGGTHVIAGSGIAFPVAALSFDQAGLPQPISGVGISVISESVKPRAFNAAQGQIAFDEYNFTFYIRAADSPLTGHAGNSNAQCLGAAQLLQAILLNRTEMRGLAQSGINNLRVTAAMPVPGTDYKTRMIRTRAQVNYAIPE